MAEVRIEAFIKDIQENLYRGAEFLKHSTSHDQYVDDNIVHVPQAGSGVNVVINRQQLPAMVTERIDDQITYQLNEYTTDPIVIRNIETIQLSYDKRMSVMKEFINAINQQLGDNGAYAWANGLFQTNASTSSRILRTGSATGNKEAVANFPSLSNNSATGVRGAMQLSDIIALKGILDRDNVPQEGRHLLIPSDMWIDLVQNNVTILGSRLYQPDEELVVDGSVAKIYGFNIWQRPVVNVYSDGTPPTLKAVGAAGATTDCLGCLAWQEDVMAKAQGAVKFFTAQDRPEYYGSLYSALVMFANTCLREDAKGVAALVQYYAAS